MYLVFPGNLVKFNLVETIPDPTMLALPLADDPSKSSLLTRLVSLPRKIAWVITCEGTVLVNYNL